MQREAEARGAPPAGEGVRMHARTEEGAAHPSGGGEWVGRGSVGLKRSYRSTVAGKPCASRAERTDGPSTS